MPSALFPTISLFLTMPYFLDLDSSPLFSCTMSEGFYLCISIYMVFVNVHGSLLSVTVPNRRYRLRQRNNHSFCVCIQKFKSVACDLMPIYRLFHLWNSMSLDGCNVDHFVISELHIFNVFRHRLDLFISSATSISEFLPSSARL